MRVEYTIRIATADDAEAVSAIAARTFFDTFVDVYSTGDMSEFLVEAYNVDKIRSEMQDPSVQTLLVYPGNDQKTPCAYAMLHDGHVRTGDSGPPEDYFQIHRLYVDKPFHGKGAAYILTDHIMEIVKQKNRKITWLGVWENNFRARKFYEKYGFEETGEHVFMVGTTKDRDLLYTWKRTVA